MKTGPSVRKIFMFIGDLICARQIMRSFQGGNQVNIKPIISLNHPSYQTRFADAQIIYLGLHTISVTPQTKMYSQIAWQSVFNQPVNKKVDQREISVLRFISWRQGHVYTGHKFRTLLSRPPNCSVLIFLF